MKKIKKAFTLVELVVVIAVIAILSAIGAITYVSVTNNARKSNDISALSTLNKGLAMAESYYGKKPENMHEAMEGLNEVGGISDPGKFLTCQYKKFGFAYHLPTNRFVLLEEDSKIKESASEYSYPAETVGKEYEYWKVVDSVEQNSEYSQYLSENSTFSEDITIKAGFDAGDSKFKNSVEYSNGVMPHTVVIRTNGGILTIDDESTGTIYHYNKADSVNIIECHTASYHEFGTVPSVEIAEGHIVFETGSAAGRIHVDTKYINKSAGTKEASTFGNVEISVAAGAAMPEFSRDSVETIAVDGTKVCTLDLAGEKNDVVLFQNGIYEQIKVVNTTDGARWVDTSDATQATKTAADQLANNISGTKGTDYTIAEETRELTITNADKAKVSDGGTLLVHTMDELKAALTAKKAEYITFANNISYKTNGSDLANVTHSCTIDGAGYVLSGYGNRSNNKTTLAINNGGSSMVNVTLKNLTITSDGYEGRPIETRGNIGTINFDNVTINATGGGNTQCLTIGGSQATSAIVNISNSVFDAGSGGYPYISFNPAKVTITNSELHGYCAMYIKGQLSSAGSRGSIITAINCNFDAPNIHQSADGWNSFGCFVIEDDGIQLTVDSCTINAVEKNTAEQYAFVMSSDAKRFEQKVSILVNGDSTEIGGICDVNNSNWTSKKAYSIEIQGGKYTANPSEFVDTNSYNINNVGGYYVVTAK